MRDLGKLILAKGFKKLPKLQEIAQSGHTDRDAESSQVQLVERYWNVFIKKCLFYTWRWLSNFQLKTR